MFVVWLILLKTNMIVYYTCQLSIYQAGMKRFLCEIFAVDIGSILILL